MTFRRSAKRGGGGLGGEFRKLELGIKTDPGWNFYAGSRIPTIPESQSKTAEHIESLPNSDRNSNKHELNPRNINYFVSNMSDK